LAALEKPAGVLAHPNQPADRARSLLAAAYDEEAQVFSWVGADGRAERLWLLHRLDSATSGVVLVARVAQVAEAVRAAFEARTVHKRYVAVVFGHAREKQALWRDALSVQREEGAVRVLARGGAPAECRMRCLRALPGPPALSLLQLEPLTGRTHQLRVQCAARHLPILGDQTYGDFRRNREWARRLGSDRLFLHAAAVKLEFVAGGQQVGFAAEVPLPAAFAPFSDGR